MSTQHEPAEPDTEQTDEPDLCPLSKRVDGPKHSWTFDGDDPYIICFYCEEVRDARTGRVITPGKGQPEEDPETPADQAPTPLSGDDEIFNKPARWEIRATIYRNDRKFAISDALGDDWDFAVTTLATNLERREIQRHIPKKRP